MDFLLFGPSMSPVALIVILVIALLIFGKRLPEVARSLGKGIVEFKKGVKGIEEEVEKPLPPPGQYGQQTYNPNPYGQQAYPGQQQQAPSYQGQPYQGQYATPGSQGAYPPPSYPTSPGPEGAYQPGAQYPYTPPPASAPGTVPSQTDHPAPQAKPAD